MAMPRLLRFTIMNDADSPPSRIGAKRRQSSPPGSFSTLMTSAPISASIMPQIGPDMMCASSMTRMPLSGPLDLAVSFASISTPLEFRFDLVEKGLVSGTKILGAKARETFIAFFWRQWRRVHRTFDKLLVPARDKRRAIGDPPGCPD